MKKNMFVAKLGMFLMMLFGSVSIVNGADLVQLAAPTITVDGPIKMIPGMEAEISINYESKDEYSGYQMKVALPEGLSVVEEKDEEGEIVYGTLGDACSAKYHASDISFKDNEIFFIVFSVKNTMLKKGTLCKFKVKANEKLAKDAKIELREVMFAAIGVTSGYLTLPEITVNNIKDEWDANEAANTKINEALMTTMTALDAADATINETCLESLREGYLDKLADCATVINQKGMELSAKYAAIELTEKDVEDFVAVCAETQTKIQAILDEAAAMTKKFETNEAANATFQAAFTEISTLLNDADAKINDECPDVKDTYLDQLAEIATQVNQKGMELGSLYAAVELTQEVADKAAAEINAFAAQIKDIVAAAVKAQNEIATGIHGINADFQNAEAVYSIGGVRLNKAAKGVNVVIRNGKAIKVVK
ncbi:hypothetical protein KUA49_004420 [Segatella copri]|uniref:hypothetical protein n=1 Tax=Segatella copri TaxID=165179 RepID=UPI001C45FB0D|nr:hypothetical protein [Segatella copri]WOZ85640.1 hypothetical protein KUA49_004420 [Segatella copri]